MVSYDTVLAGIVLSLLIQASVQSPITVPLKPGGDLDKVIPDYFDTKRFKNYHKMSPVKKSGVRELNVMHDMFSCNIDLKLRWSTMLGSPIFTTPVAFPSGKHNEKQIYVSTYYQYIESLSHDGSKSWGWPLSMEDSSFQTSPLIYDIDGDGNTDIGVVDKNGNLFWIRTGEFGEYLEDYHITIPKLRVRRDWYEGLDPSVSDSNVRMSMFDRSGNSLRHRDATRPESDLPDPPGYKAIPNAKLDELKTAKRKLPPNAKTPKVSSVAAAAAAASGKVAPKPGLAPAAAPALSNKKEDVGGRRLTEAAEGEEELTLVEHPQSPPGDIEAPFLNSADAPPVGREPEQVQQNQQQQQQKQEEQLFPLKDAPPDVVGGGEGEEYAPLPAEFTEELSVEDRARLFHGDDDYAEQMRMHHNYAPLETKYSPEEDPDAAILEASERDIELTREQQEASETEGEGAGATIATEDEEEADPEMPIHYGYGARNARRSADDGGFNYYAGAQYGGSVSTGNDSKYILIDSHILATPVLSDINRDGHMEIIFAVSYYFDKSEYANKPGINYDPDNYVAGGIVVWDMESQDWTWMVHLDLTTTKSEFQALIYSTPTVADLDGDGKYEIIVGTSLGLLYVLDGESGFIRRYFPMQFHSIQAQVAVGDVLGGRDLEIIVADMGGTVAVVNLDGDVLWDVQLSGKLPFTPTLGDVNGDGRMDIVVATVAPDGCHIYVLDGETGETLEGYPVALPEKAQITSSVLLVDLGPTSTSRFDHSFDFQVGNSTLRKNKSGNLHMVVTSFDGHVYIMGVTRNMFGNGNFTSFLKETPCAQRIDIGEHIYSQPLVDDIDGDGFLDFVIGTMNGQMLLFESAVPSNVMNSWSSFPKHRLNGFTHADKGIMISSAEKTRLKQLDIHGGHELEIKFDVFDARFPMTLREINERDKSVKYSIQVTKGTNKLEPIFKAEYTRPGQYRINVPVNPPETSLFVISMTDEHGQYYEDTVYVSLSTRFYVWLKYMVVAPIVILCMPLLFRFFKYL